MHDLTGANWHKSTRSGDSGDCVEVADVLPHAPGYVAVRDSKNPSGATLCFTDAEWNAFIGGVHDGEFNVSR